MQLIRTLVLIFGCLSFIVVIGGAAYEHLAVVPVWASAVPASLSMFQGDYALAATRFWIPVHPVTLALLAAALILNWRTRRRAYIIGGLAGYIAVLLTTFIYFVPELVSITGSPFGATVDAELTHRARAWESLSLVRLAFLNLLAVILLFGLSRPPENKGTGVVAG